MSQPDNLWFLFAAYGAIWLLLALFLTRLTRKHRALEKELGELKLRIGDTPYRHSPTGSAVKRGDSPP